MQILGLGFLESSVSEQLIRPRGAAFMQTLLGYTDLNSKARDTRVELQYKGGIAVLEGMTHLSLFRLDWLLKIVLESKTRRIGENFYMSCN